MCTGVYLVRICDTTTSIGGDWGWTRLGFWQWWQWQQVELRGEHGSHLVKRQRALAGAALTHHRSGWSADPEPIPVSSTQFPLPDLKLLGATEVGNWWHVWGWNMTIPRAKTAGASHMKKLLQARELLVPRQSKQWVARTTDCHMTLILKCINKYFYREESVLFLPSEEQGLLLTPAMSLL